MGELFIEYFAQRFPRSAGLALLAASGGLLSLLVVQNRADIRGPALVMIWVAIVGLALGGCTVFAFGVRRAAPRRQNQLGLPPRPDDTVS